MFCALYFTKSPLQKLSYRFFGSPGRRIDAATRALGLAGFDAPTVTLHGTLASGADFIFTEAINAPTVADRLRAAGTGGGIQPDHQLITQFGRCVGRLHSSGFLLGAPGVDRVLAHESASGYRFTFLDVEPVVRRRSPSGRALLRELKTLSRSAAALDTRAQMRFFRAWCQQMPELNRTEARILAASAYCPQGQG